jgi:putative membrane protein insertion efficiency factor
MAGFETPRRLSALVVIALVRAYQRFVSPALPRRCKYEPTCSAYAVSALRSHGLWRGLVLAGWRLLRCNPFSHGGYDPVTEQKLFRAPRSPRPSTAHRRAHHSREAEA